jgi:hypothetical protein
MSDARCGLILDTFDLVKLGCLMLDARCPMWLEPRSFVILDGSFDFRFEGLHHIH